MTCVQDYRHHNTTEKLLSMSKGFKVSEYKASDVSSLPETVDWRTGGAVTHVKDQVQLLSFDFKIECFCIETYRV